jgi:S-adenosylmethionine synthetase
MSAFSSRNSRHYITTSESVTEGHPDKVADQISDAVVDAHLAQDPNARVACETVTKGGMALIFGEVKSRATVPYEELTRSVLRDIGYTDPRYGFDAETSSIVVSLVRQSDDYLGKIDSAVDASGDLAGADAVGAGDQGIMIGYAVNETPELMPVPITLAHQLARRLAGARKSGELPYLRPDGKTQVTVQYDRGRVVRVHTILLLAHHDDGVDPKRLHADLYEAVVKPVIPEHLLSQDLRYYSNPTGRFVLGGPLVDTGLTGRKLQIDTYGGAARHGGGAFSGKDPTKVDRSGAYAARYVAKNIVAAGLADAVEVQIAYAVAMSEPLSVSLETFGTNKVPDERIYEAVRSMFDLRPGAIIRDHGLRRPIFRPTAAYGHFGRTDIDLPWERVDRAAELASALGLEPVAALH